MKKFLSLVIVLVLILSSFSILTWGSKAEASPFEVIWRRPIKDVYWESVGPWGRGPGGLSVDVGDVDGDGVADVAVLPRDWTYGGGGTNNTLQVFKSDGSELWSASILIDGGRVAIADVDGDGKGEVFAFGTTEDTIYSNAVIYAFDDDGRKMWEYQDIDDYGFWAVYACWVIFTNVDADPELEIIVANGGYPNRFTYALDTDGSLIWRFIGNEAEQLLFGDINGDNVNEVIVLTNVEHMVYVVNKNNGNLIWSFSTINYNRGVLGDITGDGINDIIVASGGAELYTGNRLYVIKNDGSLLWTRDYNEGASNRPTVPVLEDINDDGINDIIVGADQKIIAYRNDGTFLWDFGNSTFFDGQSPQLYRFDINRDGKEEIIFLVGKDVYQISKDGTSTLIGTLPLADIWGLEAFGGKVTEKASMKTSWLVSGDINNDGFNELLFYEVIDGQFYVTVIKGFTPIPRLEITWQMVDESDNLITPGDIVKYELTLTNIGSSTLYGVKVRLTSKKGTPISIGPEYAGDFPSMYAHPSSTTDAEISQSYGDIEPGCSKTRIFTVWVWLDYQTKPGDPLFTYSIYDKSAKKTTIMYNEAWKIPSCPFGPYDLNIDVTWDTGSMQTQLRINVNFPDYSKFYPDTDNDGHPDVLLKTGEVNGMPIYNYVPDKDQEFTLGSKDGPDYIEGAYVWLLPWMVRSISDTYHLGYYSIRATAAKSICFGGFSSVSTDNLIYTYYTYYGAADDPVSASRNIYDYIRTFYQGHEQSWDARWMDEDIISKASYGEYGDCVMFTDLTISLHRSVNIPARFVAADSEVYIPGVTNTLEHAWAEVLLPPLPQPGLTPPKWVQVDPALNLYDYPAGYWIEHHIRWSNVRYCNIRDCLYTPLNYHNIPILTHQSHWSDAEGAPNTYFPKVGTPQSLVLKCTASISSGESVKIPLNVPPTQTVLRTTLVWSGSDLDLHVYDPHGHHIGVNYVSNTTDMDIPFAKYYSSRTLESIIVENPESGTWILEVCAINATDEDFCLTASLEPVQTYTPTVDIKKTYQPNCIQTKRRGAVISVINITVTTSVDVVLLNLTDTLPSGWNIKNLNSVSAVIFNSSGQMLEISRKDTMVNLINDKLEVLLNFTNGVHVTDGDGREYILYSLKFNETLQIKYPSFPPTILVPEIQKNEVIVHATGLRNNTLTTISFGTLEIKSVPPN